MLNNANVRSSPHFSQSVKTRAPTSAESSNRAASTKYFVIKYGPPASGKGSIEPLVCSLLGIREYVDVNVDLYVQLLHGASTPPDQDTYWNKLRGPANTISDQVLRTAQDAGMDIMWETTGSADKGKNANAPPPLRWMVDNYINPAKAKGYTVVLVMPLVDTYLMSGRCMARKQAANCDLAYLKSKKQLSSSNFPFVADACHRVIVYDNNSSLLPPQVFYDSERKECTLPLQRLKDTTNANAMEVTRFVSERACGAHAHAAQAAGGRRGLVNGKPAWTRTARKVVLKDGSVRTLYSNAQGQIRIRQMRKRRDGKVTAVYVKPPAGAGR